MNDLNEFMATEVMGYADYAVGKAAVPIMVGDGDEMVDIDFSWIDWHPTTDIAQAMMCADKFYNISGNRVIIHILKYEDMPLAICSAIQQAVENGK